MSPLEEWDAAAERPFVPAISKESHFLVGFTLLLIGNMAHEEALQCD